MTAKILFAVVVLLTFLITVLISKKLIPALASRKMGQKILDIGPRWHKSKEGTPTMGGLAFIAASLFTGAGASVYLWITKGAEATLPLVITLVMAVLSGLIGVIDDSAKLRRAQNEGLTSSQKFLLQLLLSGAYLFAMGFFCKVTTELYIPFVNVTVNLGVFYYVIALLLLTGIMNSVNLTDGIDGLCSTITFEVGAFFAVAAFFAFGEVNESLSVMGALMMGSALGFLMYNLYPARVFMGDTGSLFFGAMVVGGAFIINNPLIVLVCGLMYVIETASVMLQVTYFKLTHGKRLFKMSPIHHHFEKCGWKETKIVTVFGIATVLFCVLAWFGLNR